MNSTVQEVSHMVIRLHLQYLHQNDVLFVPIFLLQTLFGILSINTYLLRPELRLQKQLRYRLILELRNLRIILEEALEKCIFFIL